METVSLKLGGSLLHDMEKTMKQHRYATKTEFIREAIRDKMRFLEREAALRKLYGSSKRRTTSKQLHKAGERAVQELERELM